MVIGVLGGMGTFATIHMFEQYADVFKAEKEWDRPRIIIDNRCTMPSRVKAFLYNDGRDRLIEEMTDSMSHLISAGCDRIILACNTSHLFLPDIYKGVPELEGHVVNIIDACVNAIMKDGIREVYLLGSEGTIESSVYQNALNKIGVKCSCPAPEEYSMLRVCIEAVKQNVYSQYVEDTFCRLMNRNSACILGCTELPILYEKYKAGIRCSKVYDPVQLVLKSLKEEFDNE